MQAYTVRGKALLALFFSVILLDSACYCRSSTNSDLKVQCDSCVWLGGSFTSLEVLCVLFLINTLSWEMSLLKAVQYSHM